MDNLVLENHYKRALLSKQAKIFSCYLVLGFIFSSIFFSLFLFEKFQYKQPPVPIISISSDNITVSKGQNLQQILSEYKIPFTEVLSIIEIAKPKIDLRHLNIGQNIEIQYEQEAVEGPKLLKAITIKTNSKEKVLITKENNTYQLSIIPITVHTSLVKTSGIISENVITSALKAGIPLKNIMEFINYYSYEIDFQRDLRTGDKFSLIYEKLTPEGEKHSTIGKTIFANLILSGKEHKMYRFKPNNGPEDFFGENNASIKRPLLKTPVQSARISSKFGLRKHPILGYSLMHKGIDFAAMSGTPIYAAGNGTVVEIGHKGSYGRYIKVKHNNELYTAYAHARGFAKGLKRGSKVSQGEIIAYVGASGRASGPHLHYEIIHRGKQIDPLKFKVPSYIKLQGENLNNFKKAKLELDELANKH